MLNQSIGGLLMKVFGAGLTFIASVILARLLGPEGFGIYAVVLSSATILATIGALGLPALLVREVAICVEYRRWDTLRGLLAFGHRWAGIASAIGALGIAVAAWAWSETSWHRAWTFAAILVPVLTLNAVRSAVLRGLHWVLLADVPELLIRPSAAILVLCLGVWLGRDLNAGSAVAIQLLAALLAFVTGTALLARKTPGDVAHVRAAYENRTWTRQATPFLGIAIFAIAEQQLPLLMLGGMSGTRPAGLYHAASQLVSLVAFGLLAVNAALQPKLAAAWSAGDRERTQQLATEAVRIGAMFALVAGSVLAAFAESWLSLFGPDYVQAAPSLRVLIVGQMVNALAGSCGVLLSMTGHQREVLRAVAVAFLVNALACYLLIPRWDVAGAAVAAAAGLASWNAYLAYRAMRLLGIRTVFSFRN